MGPTHPSTRTTRTTFTRKCNETIDSFISIINTKKQADLLRIRNLGDVSLEVEMKATRDPEGAELHHLVGVCDLAGKQVLEIGCGDGKFISQYAGLPNKLVGIDPEFGDLCAARKKISAENWPYFIDAIGESLPFASQSFDLVIFASSL